MALGLVGRGEHDEPIRPPGVRDEHLRAVEDVLVTLPDCGRLNPRDVGPGIRLAEPEGAEDGLLDERWQPALLLLIAAREHHGSGAERVRDDRDCDPGAAPRELLADQHAVEAGEAETAVLLGDVGVHQADLVGLGDDVCGVRRVLVVLRSLRADLLLRELPRQASELPLLVRELERDPRRECPRLFDRSHLGTSPSLIDSSVNNLSQPHGPYTPREWTSSSPTSSA